MLRRILLVDDDESVRAFCTDVLKRDSLEVVSVGTPDEALKLAAASRFDLFLLDINLPKMSGFVLRQKLKDLPGGNAPVIFLTGADVGVEIEIAHSLKGEKLLMKPLAGADLRRAVKVALKLVRAEAGPMPDAMDRIFGIVARDRESGVLTCVNGTTLKRVVFRDGKVAFAASNDPREVIGQAFVRAGLISEKDLAAALSQREASGGKPLGVVLTALRKVTREQADKVFAKKIREALLELYLWRRGMAEFVATVEESETQFPIALDLAPLAAEGRRRREKWIDVQKALPDPSVTFEVKKWPAGFPKNDGDKVLGQHIESGRSMAEIMVELRGQDYAIGVRLAELVKSGAIAPAVSKGFSGAAAPAHDSITVDLDDALSNLDDEALQNVDDGSGAPDEIPSITRILPGRAAPPPVVTPDLTEDSVAPLDFDEYPPKPQAPQESPTFRAPTAPERRHDSIHPPGGMPETVGMLTRALVLMRAGDLAGARAGIIEVLALDPVNPLARQRLDEIEAQLASEARRASHLSLSTRLKLGVKLEALVGRPIPPNDAFVLTRLAGTALTIGELIQICPLPENEIWQVIERHIASGILVRA